jgi:hypothetical protein
MVNTSATNYSATIMVMALPLFLIAVQVKNLEYRLKAIMLSGGN